jgi:hypothetical protein
MRGPHRVGLLAAAALLAAVLIGGAIAIGSGLVRLTSVVPSSPDASLNSVPAVTSTAPAPSSSPAPSPSPTPTSYPASWTATIDMAHPRGGHSATLLRDGRVLVVGGREVRALGETGDDGLDLSSAELFDPTSGTWSTTGRMVTQRDANHTATLLQNGMVLVAGGDSGPKLASARLAELFDPASGRWAKTGSMTTARVGHTATLLPDGKVLVAGGTINDRYLASAELYDPASGRWTATGSMAEARWDHAATLLANGLVLVAGGFVDNGVGPGLGSGPALASAELYDPSSGRWSATGPMTEARMGHTATLMANGNVMVVGGAPNPVSPGLTSAELYDPASGRWTATASMTTIRMGHTATLLPDGRVLVTGGLPTELAKDDLASAELYDPDTGRWTPTASMAGPRWGHTAALLTNGTVLVAGGIGVADGGYELGLASAELYRPTDGN